MDHQQDPFRGKSHHGIPLVPSSSTATQIQLNMQEQDGHLTSLHKSLVQVRDQTTQINTELVEQHELLSRLGGRMEHTESRFERATVQVRRLYADLTDRRFTWTATALIVILMLLLVVLIAM